MSFIFSLHNKYIVKVVSFSSVVFCSGRNVLFSDILNAFSSKFPRVVIQGFTEAETKEYMDVGEDKYKL